MGLAKATPFRLGDSSVLQTYFTINFTIDFEGNSTVTVLSEVFLNPVNLLGDTISVQSNVLIELTAGAVSPHFSPATYCGGGSGHVYCVALGRASRQTVESASEALGRAPCIHARLHRLATKPGEKCGLVVQNARSDQHHV